MLLNSTHVYRISVECKAVGLTALKGHGHLTAWSIHSMHCLSMPLLALWKWCIVWIFKQNRKNGSSVQNNHLINASSHATDSKHLSQHLLVQPRSEVTLLLQRQREKRKITEDATKIIANSRYVSLKSNVFMHKVICRNFVRYAFTKLLTIEEF